MQYEVTIDVCERIWTRYEIDVEADSEGEAWDNAMEEIPYSDGVVVNTETIEVDYLNITPLEKFITSTRIGGTIIEEESK